MRQGMFKILSIRTNETKLNKVKEKCETGTRWVYVEQTYERVYGSFIITTKIHPIKQICIVVEESVSHLTNAF